MSLSYRVTGNVERIGPGECGNVVCRPGYTGKTCKILDLDKESPVVDYCPPDQFFETKNFTSVIRWKMPKFSDNIKVNRVVERSGYKHGTFLPPPPARPPPKTLHF